MPFLTLPVRDVIEATPTARILRVGLDGLPFTYHAGQAAIVGLHNQPVRKPYSIASAPEEAREQGALEFLIRVEQSGQLGSHFAGLSPGAKVDLEGPYGSFQFPDAPTEQNFVFIAGGTGIAPLRAMLWHALLTEKRGRFGVVYSVRSPDEFAYGSELRRLAQEGRIKLIETVTRPGDDAWTGERGRINAQRLAPLVDDPATLCFLCGPRSLIESVPALLRELGLDDTRIRMEDW